VDGTLLGVDPAGSLPAAGTGSYVFGLSERSAPYVRTNQAAGTDDRGRGEAGTCASAGSDPGLQALRGVAHISAVTIAVELGNITSRFQSARKLMGYCGVFPSEDSSGKHIRKGGITKTGNAHLRRIVVESAWSYRHRSWLGAMLRRRQEGVSAEITEIAWKAQNRLHKRYMKLMAAGKDRRKTMTAIGRELMGFIWAIGIKAESACTRQRAA
jgi:transposase